MVDPAYAGMILHHLVNRPCVAGGPRVCGDDPAGGKSDCTDRTVDPAYAGMIP